MRVDSGATQNDRLAQSSRDDRNALKAGDRNRSVCLARQSWPHPRASHTRATDRAAGRRRTGTPQLAHRHATSIRTATACPAVSISGGLHDKRTADRKIKTKHAIANRPSEAGLLFTAHAATPATHAHTTQQAPAVTFPTTPWAGPDQPPDGQPPCAHPLPQRPTARWLPAHS